VRYDVDLPAARTAHVRSIAAGLDLKFAHGIRRRTQVLRVERGISICSAIEKKEVCVGTCTANNHSRALPWAPVERVRTASLSAKTYMCARNGKNKVNQHAPVQRELANGLRLDHFSDTGVRGAHRLAACGNRHIFL